MHPAPRGGGPRAPWPGRDRSGTLDPSYDGFGDLVHPITAGRQLTAACRDRRPAARPPRGHPRTPGPTAWRRPRNGRDVPRWTSGPADFTQVVVLRRIARTGTGEEGALFHGF